MSETPDIERVVCDFCGQDQTTRLETLPILTDLPLPMHRLGAMALDLGSQRIHFCKCHSCGLVYMNPRLTESAIARFYDTVYSTPVSNIGYEGDLNGRGAYLLSKAAPLINTFQPSMLDIGCGGGQFLKVAQDRGWKVAGSELSKVAAKSAGALLGVPIHVGDFRDMRPPSGSLDFVSLLEVIEHLRAPIDYLRDAVTLLKPRGILLIEIPNVASLEYSVARLLRQYYRGFIIEHLYYFTPTFIRRLLTDLGLEIVFMSSWTPSARYPNPLRDIWEIMHRSPRATASVDPASPTPGATLPVPPLKPVSFPQRVLRQVNNYMFDTVSKLSEGWKGSSWVVGNTLYVWARKRE